MINYDYILRGTGDGNILQRFYDGDEARGKMNRVLMRYSPPGGLVRYPYLGIAGDGSIITPYNLVSSDGVPSDAPYTPYATNS